MDSGAPISAPPGEAGTLPDADSFARLGRRLDRPIVLVGMMGVGKTSLGRRLAALLAARFIDADEEIEKAAAMPIPEIFESHGEAYFRDGERRVIARLLAKGGDGAAKVIATGGGAFCNAETRALILARAIAVWVDADLDTLVERTARKGNRPLLQAGDPRAILARLKAEREGDYAQAQVQVVSGGGPHIRVLQAVAGGVHAWLDAADSAQIQGTSA